MEHLGKTMGYFLPNILIPACDDVVAEGKDELQTTIDKAGNVVNESLRTCVQIVGHCTDLEFVTQKIKIPYIKRISGLWTSSAILTKILGGPGLFSLPFMAWTYVNSAHIENMPIGTMQENIQNYREKIKKTGGGELIALIEAMFKKTDSLMDELMSKKTEEVDLSGDFEKGDYKGIKVDDLVDDLFSKKKFKLGVMQGTATSLYSKFKTLTKLTLYSTIFQLFSPNFNKDCFQNLKKMMIGAEEMVIDTEGDEDITIKSLVNEVQIGSLEEHTKFKNELSDLFERYEKYGKKATLGKIAQKYDILLKKYSFSQRKNWILSEQTDRLLKFLMAEPASQLDNAMKYDQALIAVVEFVISIVEKLPNLEEEILNPKASFWFGAQKSLSDEQMKKQFAHKSLQALSEVLSEVLHGLKIPKGYISAICNLKSLVLWIDYFKPDLVYRNSKNFIGDYWNARNFKGLDITNATLLEWKAKEEVYASTLEGIKGILSLSESPVVKSLLVGAIDLFIPFAEAKVGEILHIEKNAENKREPASFSFKETAGALKRILQSEKTSINFDKVKKVLAKALSSLSLAWIGPEASLLKEVVEGVKVASVKVDETSKDKKRKAKMEGIIKHATSNYLKPFIADRIEEAHPYINYDKKISYTDKKIMTINNNVSDTEKKIFAIDEKISAIEIKFPHIEANFNKFSTLDKEISAIDKNLVDIENKISRINIKISDFQKRISAINQYILIIENKVANIDENERDKILLEAEVFFKDNDDHLPLNDKIKNKRIKHTKKKLERNKKNINNLVIFLNKQKKQLMKSHGKIIEKRVKPNDEMEVIKKDPLFNEFVKEGDNRLKLVSEKNGMKNKVSFLGRELKAKKIYRLELIKIRGRFKECDGQIEDRNKEIDKANNKIFELNNQILEFDNRILELDKKINFDEGHLNKLQVFDEENEEEIKLREAIESKEEKLDLRKKLTEELKIEEENKVKLIEEKKIDDEIAIIKERKFLENMPESVKITVDEVAMNALPGFVNIILNRFPQLGAENFFVNGKKMVYEDRFLKKAAAGMMENLNDILEIHQANYQDERLKPLERNEFVTTTVKSMLKLAFPKGAESLPFKTEEKTEAANKIRENLWKHLVEKFEVQMNELLDLKSKKKDAKEVYAYFQQQNINKMFRDTLEMKDLNVESLKGPVIKKIHHLLETPSRGISKVWQSIQRSKDNRFKGFLASRINWTLDTLCHFLFFTLLGNLMKYTVLLIPRLLINRTVNSMADNFDKAVRSDLPEKLMQTMILTSLKQLTADYSNKDLTSAEADKLFMNERFRLEANCVNKVLGGATLVNFTVKVAVRVADWFARFTFGFIFLTRFVRERLIELPSYFLGKTIEEVKKEKLKLEQDLTEVEKELKKPKTIISRVAPFVRWIRGQKMLPLEEMYPLPTRIWRATFLEAKGETAVEWTLDMLDLASKKVLPMFFKASKA